MSVIKEAEWRRIALLEAVHRQAQGMGRHRAALWRYESDPPWKSSLTGMCECLSVAGAIPALDRRNAEDALANTVYHGIPAPERELLALRPCPVWSTAG